MKKYLSRSAIGFCLLGLVSSFGARAEFPTIDAYSDPLLAAESRAAVHRLMAIQLNDAIALATGQKPWNGYWIQQRGDTMEQLARMSYPFFMVPDSFEGTKAKAEIYEQQEEFKKYSLRSQTAIMGMTQAFRSRNEEASKNGIANTIASCNACHEKYMEPALLYPMPKAPEN